MAVSDPSQHTPPARRRRGRGVTWVSKTHVTSFLRCPYAFYQVDSGALSPTDAIDALGERLIEEGLEFEQSITAQAVPLPPEIDLTTAFLGQGRIHGLPLLQNEPLRLCGIPDAVDARGGELIPIEIKSHRDLRRTDELELAFYWRVLEPYRTVANPEPRGILILRQDGGAQEVEVQLSPERFAELDTVIDQVREARKNGVRPRICGCTVCSGPLRDQIARQTWAGRDLTLIWGIARKIAVHLEDLGIADFDALDDHDPATLAGNLVTRRVNVSTDMVKGWSQHARSYREGRAVMFGAPPTLDESFIALDLEYDSAVWLTGALVCDHDRREHNYFWADTPDDEEEALLALEAMLATYPDLPVVTWSGTSADLPQLRYAAARHNLLHVFTDVDRRHLDLYQHAIHSMRIPHPELSLKAVADYFGIPKVSNITNGLEAGFLYAQYRHTQDPVERQRRQAELVAYNRDDLEATAAMVKIMCDGPECWPAPLANQWDQERADHPTLPRRLRPTPALTRAERVAARRSYVASTGQAQISTPENPRNLPF